MRSERGELGLVLLDYIQKLGDRACRNRAQTVGKFSGAFKERRSLIPRLSPWLKSIEGLNLKLINVL